MNTEPELLNERLERLAIVLDEIMPQCAILVRDALALLKEQEAVEPEWYDGTPFCGNCGHRLEKKNRNMKEIKCPTCGRTVKWE